MIKIIKKIAVILPIIALCLFIYTLNFMSSRNDSSTGISVENLEESILETTTQSSVIETTSAQVTTLPTTTSTVTTVTTTSIVATQTNVVSNIVTPFSKTPEAPPLKEIKPVSVVTPSEIVIESISLIVPEGTSNLCDDTVDDLYDEMMQTSVTSSQTTVTTMPETSVVSVTTETTPGTTITNAMSTVSTVTEVSDTTETTTTITTLEKSEETTNQD